jgi:ABC-type antimicrobial peptide transport system permease subunit
MSMFGALGLILAGVGVYGVSAYGASQRKAELGLRRALGASRLGVIFLAVRRALGASLLGIVLGLGGAWVVSLALRGLLYAIAPFDLTVYGTSSLLLGAVALVAAVIPAARAASAGLQVGQLLKEER